MLRSDSSERSSGRPSSAPRRRRRGQTLVEFALTLPILLLLMFGIVEFGRIFQAWITVQNAARDAARFAITGNYDQNLFPTLSADGTPDLNKYTWEPKANDILSGDTNHGLPCPLHSDTTQYISWAANAPGDASDMQLFGQESVTNSAAFQSHWDGMVCDPNSEVDRQLQKDVPRLVSIVHQAQLGAAGLSLSPGVHIPGTDINTELPNADTQPGWYHVYICSSRAQFTSNPNRNPDPTVTRYSDNPVARTCGIQEPDPPNYPGLNQPNGQHRNQYDAGGPGDFVHVVIFFNHPLLTPISFNALPGVDTAPLGPRNSSGQLQGYIQLQASRTMINEAYRYHTLITLPNDQGQFATPSPTLSGTLTDTPTSTSTATGTFTKMPTHTSTASYTPTASPTPQCSGLSIKGEHLSSDSLWLDITNANSAPAYISGASIQWSDYTKQLYGGNMFISTLRTGIQQPFWNYTALNPPAQPLPGQGATSYTLPTPIAQQHGWWKNYPSASDPEWQFNSGSTPLQISFGNVSSPLPSGLHVNDFTGTSLTFSLSAASPFGQPCTLILQLPVPTTVQTLTTFTPTSIPICSSSEYNLAFKTFQNNGQVQFQFTNNSPSPIYINGFAINWGKYGGLSLTEVDLNGADAFTRPPAIQIWTGNSGRSPTSSLSGTWHTKATVAANSVTNFWVVFSGGTGLVPGQPSDFNGTTLTLDNGCAVVEQSSATPVPTSTRTLTPRPSTPTRTPTPTLRGSPSKTFTPSKTPTSSDTPSLTYTPSFTNTATDTLTPSNTPTYTDTPVGTASAASALDDGSAPIPTSTPLPMPTYNGMGD